ncbi:MAG: chemotaxis protein CheR, partial [Hyphomonadaceae bacterium]|nr:chemotaxis protein CheR [Clostridia bacterium]
DISTKVLEHAKHGVYSQDQVEALDPLWKSNYFNKIDKENFEVNKDIKAEVIFRSFNLMEENFPFKKKFHVIFCRNVMIYFDHETKIELIRKFYEHTETGGYLFIGHSESINRSDSKYQYVLPAVYRKG